MELELTRTERTSRSVGLRLLPYLPGQSRDAKGNGVYNCEIAVRAITLRIKVSQLVFTIEIKTIFAMFY